MLILLVCWLISSKAKRIVHCMSAYYLIFCFHFWLFLSLHETQTKHMLLFMIKNGEFQHMMISEQMIPYNTLFCRNKKFLCVFANNFWYFAGNCLNFLFFLGLWLSLHGLLSSAKGTYLGTFVNNSTIHI